MQGLGCAAQKAYKQGMEWEIQNEPYFAAKSYLTALSHNPKKIDYLVALKRVAQPAYESLLSLAQSSQAANNFPKAVEQYKTLKNFITQLNRYDALSFNVINVDIYISDMSKAAAKDGAPKSKAASKVVLPNFKAASKAAASKSKADSKEGVPKSGVCL